MERGFSAQTFSSSENSDSQSHYVIEPGFYMTSLAGTIFIGALVTTGVLLVTLVVALSVMLHSCETRSAGIVETRKPAEVHHYCNVFALHADLNGLESVSFPSTCVDLAVRYVKDGGYIRELNITIRMAESYFDSITPLDDGLEAVLMDIDEILDSNSRHRSLIFSRFSHGDYMEEAKHQKYLLTLELYSKLKSKGYSVILLSRKPEKDRNASTEQLISAGYAGWSSLVMRLEHENELDSYEYLARRRVAIHKGGFRIAGTIGYHMDVLTGPCLGERVFKLPSPVYPSPKDFTERGKPL